MWHGATSRVRLGAPREAMSLRWPAGGPAWPVRGTGLGSALRQRGEILGGTPIEAVRAMPIIHLTARLWAPRRVLCDDEHAPWLWARLRHGFPDALGATLMPNHPHLVADVADQDEAFATFVRVLGAFARRIGPAADGRRRPIWEPTGPPELIEGPDKVARQLRYLDLNAPRAGLADDVLAWRWSTHLDVVGAIDDPWVTFDRVRRVVPKRLGASLQTWHGYVSGDPATDPRGTPLPRPFEPRRVSVVPLDEVAEAVTWATRSSRADLLHRGPTRRAFVWLAREQGWSNTRRIAEICRVTPRSIQRLLDGPPPSALAPARACLDLVRRVAERDVSTLADFCRG